MQDRIPVTLADWFVHEPLAPSMQVAGSYDPWLVALSLLVAIGAAWAALQLATEARRATYRSNRWGALAAGALALGAGVWSMHFIGMLAFQLCADVDYSPGITLLSMLPSLAASSIALYWLGRPSISRAQLALGGLLVGAGIGTMHYGGMLAMQMSPRLAFDPAWFAASIGIAVGLAMLALWIRFALEGRLRIGSHLANGVAGSVMGLAIAGMHYAGMAAARFIGETDPGFDPQADTHTALALGVAFVAVTIAAIGVTVHTLVRQYQLNQRLKASENRLRAVLDTAVDGIISTDQSGRILSFNASAERIFGWRAGEVLGTNVTRLMTREPGAAEAEGLNPVLREAFAGIVGAGREVLGRHRDGRAVALRLAISKTEVQGQPIFLGVVTDISARKAMEQELREREAQSRTLIANMPGVAFRNQAGSQASMIFVSDRIEALTGWPAQAFTGGQRRYEELLHADDRQRVADAMARALARGEPYAVEYRIARRDGTERWVSETAGGARDAQGRLQWVDGVLLDVTETKLRNAEFETVAKALDRGLSVLEIAPDTRILRANDNCLAMLGTTREQLIGRSHRELMPREFLQSQAYETNRDTLLRGETLSGEFLLIGQHGREVWVQGTYNAVFDDQGQFLKIMAFETDVTERKAMERELRQAKARAEQAAAARSSFLANMSHEIRTPMNAILGFTDVLLNTALAPPQRRHLETVRHAAQSLLGLLNDILDTAKLEKGAVELEMAHFSLRALCHQVAASMRLSAEKKGLVLALDFPAVQAEFYQGDALRIQQVLVNLVGNAIKFTERGRVTIEVRREADTSVIAIVDTGIGIPPDRVERIFDAFAQADATITRQFGGTGLGTTIARQLTELMGGRIVVRSDVGVGSRFEVRLPLPLGQAPVQVRAERSIALPPLSILVADDVPQNVELLELVLQADGHRVQSARDGVEAVALLTHEKFDLVLMDMHMPEMDGLAATRALRGLEREEGRVPTPVIALTASVQASDRHAALQAGMDGFATKPVVAAQLFGEMARALGLQAAPAPASNLGVLSASTGNVIDWTQGLSLWQTADRLRAAIASFLQAQSGTPQVLRECLEEQDHLALAALAHRISGAAGNLALSGLRLAAHGLERAARASNAEAERGGVQSVLAQLAAVAAEMPPTVDLHPHLPLTRPAALDADSILTNLDDLQQALQGNGLDESALQQLSEVLPPESLKQLLDAIDNFDFQAAVQCVDALRGSLRSHEPERL